MRNISFPLELLEMFYKLVNMFSNIFVTIVLIVNHSPSSQFNFSNRRVTIESEDPINHPNRFLHRPNYIWT